MDEFTALQNKIIDKHRAVLESELKSSGSFSKNSFRVKTKNKIDRRTSRTFAIGISFKQHGIFREKGVGRGRGIDSGKTIPKQWYNPVIKKIVPKLADDLELNTADLLHRTLIR
jgi:hypothetical protein